MPAPAAAPKPTRSALEVLAEKTVFRRGRTAVEHWVDEDSHRPLVLAGDLSTIKKDVLLLAIFRQFQGFGAAMQEKLMHHLEFMVENRRKYYTACSSG